jgi:hypothetical protein
MHQWVSSEFADHRRREAGIGEELIEDEGMKGEGGPHSRDICTLRQYKTKDMKPAPKRKHGKGKKVKKKGG